MAIPSSAAPSEGDVAMLEGMFPDAPRQRVLRALQLTSNNVERAIDLLLEPAPSIVDRPGATERVEPSSEQQQAATGSYDWSTHGWQNPAAGPQGMTVEHDGWGPPPSAPPGSPGSDFGNWKTTEAGPPSYPPPGHQAAQGEHREPEPLPGSPQQHYEPTLVGPSPAAPPASPTAQAMDRKQQSGTRGRSTIKQGDTVPIDLTGDDVDIPALVTDGAATTANAGFSDDEMQRAIAASLAAGDGNGGGGGGGQQMMGPVQGPSNFSEEEAINKALQESLAMSESMTLEADKRFEHPAASQRRRKRRTAEDGMSTSLPDPVSIRVSNAHLTFLPNVLLALYWAKPFRDCILSLPVAPLLRLLPTSALPVPPPAPAAASASQASDLTIVPDSQGSDATAVMDDATPTAGTVPLASTTAPASPSREEASEMERLRLAAEKYGDVSKYWAGEQEDTFDTDEESSKRKPVEHVLALQRLFALLTHTERSYVDSGEIASLLGYAEGENIAWTATEPAKGMNRTWNELADVFKSTMFQVGQSMVFARQWTEEEARIHMERMSNLIHWRGSVAALPLAEGDQDGTDLIDASADNSTSCIPLSPVTFTLGSGTDGGVNDLYSCIDAKTWMPEKKQAHLLNTEAEVIAFALDRSETNNSGAAANGMSQGKKVFGVEPVLWVDRYMMRRRRTIATLREEVSKAEGEMEAALRQKEALENSGGKNVVASLKATCAYLESYRHPDRPERTPKLESALAKYKGAYEKLEAELKKLDESAAKGRDAAKGVFDREDMRQVGPYDLTAAVIHNGFIGREHQWTYTRHDDGRWFKLVDTQVYEVPFDSVLQDTSGLHMGAGHVFLVYCRRPEAPAPSTSIEIPEALATSIKADNLAFEAEVTTELTKQLVASEPVTAGPETGGDTAMKSASSPRSDLADVDFADLQDTQVEMTAEDPLRLRGGASEEQEDSDEEMESDGEEEDDYVELGYLKKLKKTLDPMTMTGKVGGSPIWLNPTLPLGKDQLRCSSCGDSMSFLLQMSAPDDSNPDAFLRAIYVFVCRKMSCHRLHGRGALKAFRIQLPEQNPHYGDAAQSGTADVNGASDALQKVEISGRPFTAWELICEEEPEDHLPQVSAPTDTSSQEAVTEPADRDAKDSKVSVDPAFLHFQSRLARSPTQVLRYLRLSDPSIPPLWPSAVGQPDALAIPPCPRCKAARTAEFQIMPTILSSLGVDSADPDSLDFGTIVVYTCSQACTIPAPHSAVSPKPPSGWADEVCFVQAFSSEGVDFTARRAPQQTSVA